MRPDPVRPEGENVVRIGGEASTIPAWYSVETDEVTGAPKVTCRVLVDDVERAAILAGAEIALTMYGAEVPWALDIAPPGEESNGWGMRLLRAAYIAGAAYAWGCKAERLDLNGTIDAEFDEWLRETTGAVESPSASRHGDG